MNLNIYKSKLMQERERLISGLKSIANPDPLMKGDWDARYPKLGVDQTGSHSSADEEADEVEEYESRLAQEHSMESQLLEITKALERIQKQTYGACAKCKAPISEERLDANPSAEYCAMHAS